jgi:hypothetical protein
MHALSPGRLSSKVVFEKFAGEAGLEAGCSLGGKAQPFGST